MGKRGFTLLEVIIVVSIVGILAALGFFVMYPAAMQTHKDLCIVNLKYIYAAKANFFMDNPSRMGEAPSWSDLVPEYLEQAPVCPAGGGYTIGGMRTEPVCSERGHEL